MKRHTLSQFADHGLLNEPANALREEQGSPAPPPKITPLGPGRFSVQLTIGQETLDRLRYAQALLGDEVASGDLARVLELALDALIDSGAQP